MSYRDYDDYDDEDDCECEPYSSVTYHSRRYMFPYGSKVALINRGTRKTFSQEDLEIVYVVVGTNYNKTKYNLVTLQDYERGRTDTQKSIDVTFVDLFYPFIKFYSNFDLDSLILSTDSFSYAEYDQVSRNKDRLRSTRGLCVNDLILCIFPSKRFELVAGALYIIAGIIGETHVLVEKHHLKLDFNDPSVISRLEEEVDSRNNVKETYYLNQYQAAKTEYGTIRSSKASTDYYYHAINIERFRSLSKPKKGFLGCLFSRG